MNNERGFALMAALWLVVAISAIGLEIGLQSRQHRLVAINTVELQEAEAAAVAGIATAREILARPLRGGSVVDPWFAAERLLGEAIADDSPRYALSVRDAGAALNLNTASEVELKEFFRAIDVDHGQADRIAQSILDWRDPDEAHRARGAERPFYLEHGFPRLPRNGYFSSVRELAFVRDVDPEIMERAAPHVTVEGTGRISVNSASRPVLLALQGMSEEAAAVIERHRAQGRPLPDLQALTAELSPGARRQLDDNAAYLLRRTMFETRELEIHSRGWSEEATVQTSMTALLVRGGESAFLVRIREDQ